MSYLPAKLKDWTLMRMVRSGQWEADILVARMAHDILRYWPPPADGGIHLSGDSTRKDKRGQQHPLGLFRRASDHAPYTFGFDMGLLIASWDHCRLPIVIAPIDPEIKGHQHKLCRHMLATFEPPAWVTKVIVTGDAGFCAHETLRLIHHQGWIYVFAMARTRKFTNGTYVSDLVCHLPRHGYGRRATYTPDGRRRDFWVCQRRATLNQLGDVTMVLSKKRRTQGPKHVSLFVTNLLEGKASTVLSLDAWRWGVEVTIKELKGGLHLGQMQVPRDKDRVKRSVALPVCAYLLLVRLYGQDASCSGPWSLFRLKQRFMVDMANAQCDRIATRWQHKLLKRKEAA